MKPVDASRQRRSPLDAPAQDPSAQKKASIKKAKQSAFPKTEACRPCEDPTRAVQQSSEPMGGKGRCQTREDQLAAEFAELEALYSSAPVGLAVIDRDFRFIRINEQLAEINGATVADHIGRTVFEVLPDLADQAVTAMRRIFDTGEPLFDVEIVGETPAQPGVERAWRENWVPLFGNDGHVVAISVAAIEVTENKRTADALAEKEAQLRTIMETIPIGILFAEYPTGRILEGNSQVARMLRHPLFLSPDTDSYDEWVSFHADGTRVKGHEYPLARMFRDGDEAPQMEVHYQRGDGTRAWMRIMGRPVKDAQGKMVGGVVAIIDVDDQRRAEDNLKRLTIGLEQRVEQRTHALRKANALLAAEIERREAAQAALSKSQKLEALGQLTSGVAHDFNNLIAAISGGFRVIERRTQDPDLQEIARHGANAADRGAALVSQLLSFARPQELSPRTLSLRTFLEGTLPLIRETLGQDIVTTVDVPSALPPVRIDPVQLEATLLNLAVNARDAMDGRGTFEITIRSCPADENEAPCDIGSIDTVLLCVSDTGSGMSPEVLERATEPFFTTKGSGKGTGLGLAMVQGFMRQSGGAMHIESEPGKGTCFKLFLPVAPSMPVSDCVLDSSAPARTPQATRILLVDDDEAVRGITAAMLKDLGHEVVIASSAEEALSVMALDNAIGLILSDIAMPGMDGTTLSRNIRQSHPDVPVLLFTGNAERHDCYGEEVLDKPFSYEGLNRKISALLRRATLNGHPHLKGDHG